MDRLFERLRPLIRWVGGHPVVVLLIAAAATAVGLTMASRLSIDTDLANLIPESYPSVQALERLKETVGGESEAAVAIESPSFAANRAFAEDFIPEVLALRRPGRDEPFFTRVDYRKDVSFLEDNALYFGTTAELDLLEEWLEGQIEDARLEANPFYFDLEDEDEAAPDSVAEELRASYEQIVSGEYPVSSDSTTMVLRFYPSGSQTNLAFIDEAYQGLDSLIAAMVPSGYHPDMRITTAGRLQRQLIEITSIQEDVLSSFGAGVAAVLLLVLGYFLFKSYTARVGRRWNARVLAAELARLPAMAVVIAVPLLMSLSWTFGLAEITYDALNLMTSTLGLVLFGLGIDYGIHFFARYTEERGQGRDVINALEETFSSTGQAITVGALTTALALYVLVAADFRGFSQFGFMAGTGILFALIAMLIVMPALLALSERLGALNLTASGVEAAAVTGGTRFPAARVVLAVTTVAVVAAVLAVGQVGFEYRFGELEPEYAEYNARRDVMRRVYDDRRNRNPAYVVTDTPEEAEAVAQALMQAAEADTLSPTIDRVESLQDRFPLSSEAQGRRLERLAVIRELLDDPFLASDDSDDLARLRQSAGTRSPIALDQLPESLRKQFTSKTGELGNFVIIYPSVGLSDGRQSIAFSNDVGSVTLDDGRTYHAGSTSLVGADMLKLMRAEAPWMVAATLFIVLLLMVLNFRSLRWAGLALIPLVVGLLWMLLGIELLGLKLNFYNLIVLPAVLGIGNDAGVHLVHRYRERGTGSLMAVLRSTGEHVTMGSLTTMVGFAGLLLSFHPGLESIGQLAVLGIGATLLAALIFLPALLQWQEDRSH